MPPHRAVSKTKATVPPSAMVTLSTASNELGVPAPPTVAPPPPEEAAAGATRTVTLALTVAPRAAPPNAPCRAKVRGAAPTVQLVLSGSGGAQPRPVAVASISGMPTTIRLCGCHAVAPVSGDGNVFVCAEVLNMNTASAGKKLARGAATKRVVATYAHHQLARPRRALPCRGEADDDVCAAVAAAFCDTVPLAPPPPPPPPSPPISLPRPGRWPRDMGLGATLLADFMALGAAAEVVS